MKRGDAVYDAPVAQGLLDLRAIAAYLSVSVSTVERFVREGMPALDLAEHDRRRRPKRLLRFDPAEVLRWARERGQSGNGSR